MIDSVKTKKGTSLPLMNLKGKPYMQVAHRLVWFNEDVENFEITTEMLSLTDKRAIVKATVKIFDKEGKLVKSAVGTKAEDISSFPDFIEKAETGSVGRAITTLGYGTAYALADLDEGERIIDAPVTITKNSATPLTLSVAADGMASAESPTARRPRTFKRPTSAAASNGTAAVASAPTGDGF